MAEVILICGRICSGKSWYARQLQKKIPSVILSTDEVTWDLTDNAQGEGYVALAQRVNRYLRKKAVEIVKAGASVILDWGFWSEEDRKEITSFFRSNGVPFVWHYLDTDDALWQENIRQRNARVQRGEGGSDFYVDDGLLRKMRALFEEPTRDAMDVWVEVTGQHEQRITRKGERMDFPQEQDCEGKTI